MSSQIDQPTNTLNGHHNQLHIFQVRIGSLLFGLTLVSFVLAVATSDIRAEAFFLNLSAGFLGSLVTFVVLGHYENIRVKQDKISHHKLYLQQQMLALKQSTLTVVDVAQLTKRGKALTKYIDLDNPARSVEIIEIQIAVLEQLIAYSEHDLATCEYITSLANQTLISAIDIGDQELIESAGRTYQQTQQEREDARRAIQEYSELKAISADLLQTYKKRINTESN